MSFVFKKLSIPEVILVEPKLYSDNRGFFFESFKEEDFFSIGITKMIQDNFSHSIYGVVRGLHYQNFQNRQAKLIMVLSGEIFDILVDIRKNSPTYGKSITKILSDKDHDILYAPEGFAHGFCVLSEKASVLYKVSQEFSSEHERGINWCDSDLKIPWSIEKPIISKKDSVLPFLKNIDSYFVY